MSDISESPVPASTPVPVPAPAAADDAASKPLAPPVSVRPEPEAAPVPIPVPKSVAVVGEIPFAGLAVARELVLNGMTARVLCPDAETEAELVRACPPKGPAVLECVRGKLDNQESIRQVLIGAYGVVFVSPITLSGRTYRAKQHLDDVRSVTSAAKTANVERAVYQSALGANPVSTTQALSHAALSEELFNAMDLDVYRMRTSVLMGRGDHFQSEMIAGARSGSPIMGMLGYGSTMLQPLHINDMARCVARLFNPQLSQITPGVLCIAGPEMTTPMDLADMALERIGRMKLKVHAPLFALKLLASVRNNAAFKEKVNLLFEGFCTDHNDLFKLLGGSYDLITPQRSQDEIIAAI
jgi:uncharacterized protein YbjT (DUF2867 family)